MAGVFVTDDNLRVPIVIGATASGCLVRGGINDNLDLFTGCRNLPALNCIYFTLALAPSDDERSWLVLSPSPFLPFSSSAWSPQL